MPLLPRRLVALPLAAAWSLSACGVLPPGDPDFADLREDLAEMPGVAEVDLEVTEEDTDSWASRMTVVLDDEVSAEELTDAVEEFEDARQEAPPEHGLVADFAFADDPEGSRLRVTSASSTPAERAHWFVDAHAALPEATLRILEDDLDVRVDQAGPDAVTSAARALGEVSSIDEAGQVTVISGSEGLHGHRLSSPGVLDATLVERWEQTWSQLAALDAATPPVEAHLEQRGEGGEDAERGLVLTVVLALPDEDPSPDTYGVTLEPVLADLLAEDAPGGQVRELVVEAKPQDGAGSPFIDVTTDGSTIRYGDLEGSAWNRLAREGMS